jgi:hypothetical protein
MERGEVQEHAGLRQLLVVLAHLGQELLAGQVAGFPVSLNHHHPHVVPRPGTPTGADPSSPRASD